jgi:WD40 repeat protein
MDTLAVSDQSGLLQICSINTGQSLNTIIVGFSVLSLQLFTNNQGVTCLAAGLENGNINIYNTNTYGLITSLTGHSSYVNDLALISTSNLLASGGDDYTVRLWDLTTNTCKYILTGHNDWVMGLKQITSDILASGSWDTTIKLWDITTGQEIRTLTGHTSAIYKSLDLINNGQTLVSGSLDQTIKLWNWSTGECLSTIQTNSVISSMAVIDINPQQQQTTTTTSTSTMPTTTVSSKFIFGYHKFI